MSICSRHDLYLLFVRAPCVERVRASFREVRPGAPPKIARCSAAIPLAIFCGDFLDLISRLENYLRVGNSSTQDVACGARLLLLRLFVEVASVHGNKPGPIKH